MEDMVLPFGLTLVKNNVSLVIKTAQNFHLPNYKCEWMDGQTQFDARVEKHIRVKTAF